jgi:hypothetical protein
MSLFNSKNTTNEYGMKKMSMAFSGIVKNAGITNRTKNGIDRERINEKSVDIEFNLRPNMAMEFKPYSVSFVKKLNSRNLGIFIAGQRFYGMVNL